MMTIQHLALDHEMIGLREIEKRKNGIQTRVDDKEIVLFYDALSGILRSHAMSMLPRQKIV